MKQWLICKKHWTAKDPDDSDQLHCIPQRNGTGDSFVSGRGLLVIGEVRTRTPVGRCLLLPRNKLGHFCERFPLWPPKKRNNEYFWSTPFALENITKIHEKNDNSKKKKRNKQEYATRCYRCYVKTSMKCPSCHSKTACPSHNFYLIVLKWKEKTFFFPLFFDAFVSKIKRGRLWSKL